MTIEHQIKLNMNDVAELLATKLDMNKPIDASKIVITDYMPYLNDDEDGNIDTSRPVNNTKELVKKSNIVAVLKQGLTDTKNGNKFPKNPDELCETAFNAVLLKMNCKETSIFKKFILTSDFGRFAVLYQKVQTEIQKKL